MPESDQSDMLRPVQGTIVIGVALPRNRRGCGQARGLDADETRSNGPIREQNYHSWPNRQDGVGQGWTLASMIPVARSDEEELYEYSDGIWPSVLSLR